MWAMERAIPLMADGRLDVKPIITHRFSLDDINEAFDTFTGRIGGAITKPRSCVIGITALCLTSSLSISFAGERWCGCKADFWWTDSVTDREIFICQHGVQFLFVTGQRGVPNYTALVFPRPSRRMLGERLRLAPCSCRLEKEYKHYAWRYTSLLAALERISGGALRPGARLSFETAAGRERLVIIPNLRLVLRWRGEELKLRGYLDVYFAPLPRAEAPRHRGPPLGPPRPPKRGCCRRVGTRLAK